MTDREDKAHKAFVRTLPCSACGQIAPSECAHVRMSYCDTITVPTYERGGQGMKPADKWCVPMCRTCHGQQHQWGERAFWDVNEINPLSLAQSLYRNTGKTDACRGILYRARNGEPL